MSLLHDTYGSLHICPFSCLSVCLVCLFVLLTEASLLALMSPVHRSSSNVDTSNVAIASVSSHTHQHHHNYSEGEELEDPGIQRSYSMPPAMFDGEERGGGRRGSRRSGICIQHNQESRHRRKVQESRSEDELTTSGGREGDEEEEEGEEGEEGEKGQMTESYPRGRRNAIRGARLTRRATCAADGMYASEVAAAHKNAAERPE